MSSFGLIAQSTPIDPGTGLDKTLESTLDLIGVFVFAISGGLLAVRKGYEVVGVTSLALVTGLGGGTVRDVLLGATPPNAFEDVSYLIVPLVAAVIVFFGSALIDDRLWRPVLVFDAAGLGLFCVTGAVKAEAFGTSVVGAVLIGVISAVGGGIMRDVLADEQPRIFQPDSTLYAIPATLGAVIVVIAYRNDVYTGTVAVLTATCVFLFRLAAMQFDWRAPLPRRRTSSDA